MNKTAKKRRADTGCRDRILDAAERSALKHGAAHLTLDTVAKEAKVSKGGLIYHFPSKDELIIGLIERVHACWIEALQKASKEEPKGPGHPARTLFRDAFVTKSKEDELELCRRQQQLVACLVAAVAHKPEIIKSIRSTYVELLSSFEKDTFPLGKSLLMLSAYDALWWSGVFNTYTLNESQREALRLELETMLQSASQKSVRAIPRSFKKVKAQSSPRPFKNRKKI